jgi:hypothetical protein
MGWVEQFYSLKAEWLAEPVDIFECERRRVSAIERLCGPAPRRILELGAGSGALRVVRGDFYAAATPA